MGPAGSATNPATTEDQMFYTGQAVEVAPRFCAFDGEPLDEYNNASGHVVATYGEDVEIRLIDGTEVFVNFRRVRAVNAR